MPRRPHVAVTLTQRWHRVPGGTATSIERLVTALLATERVGVTCVEPLGELRRPTSLVRAMTIRRPDGVARLPLPLPVLYDSWTRFGRPRISGVVDDIDLIHLTVPVTPPDDDVPLVATVHDLFPLTHPELMTTRGSKLMAQGLESIRKRARRVMVPTEFVAAECAARGFDESRVTVVPWGVTSPGQVASADVPTDAEDTAAVLRRHGISGPYVLFVGTLEPRKNLALLLEAMIRLSRPEVSLALVGPAGWGDALGDGDGPQIGDVPSPVLRLGFVPTDDLAHLERGAAAFCYPSLAEGFGLPVLEAMAAGAAVITSAGTACAEVAGDGAVLIDPRSSADLVDAIAMLIDDKTRSSDLRQRGLRRSKQFTWERSGELTLAAYEAALS